jgi:hypothetical protein
VLVWNEACLCRQREDIGGRVVERLLVPDGVLVEPDFA